jgi:anti-sigma regulatory factor (Ser/Thr protein kinase)
LSRVRETFIVAGGASAPRAARGLVRRAAEPLLDAEALDDLDLLVSEVVTNAVRHGDADLNATITIELSLTDGRARVTVSDPGVGFDPLAPRVSRDGIGGNGLVLLDGMARDWGVDSTDRFRVWFER